VKGKIKTYVFKSSSVGTTIYAGESYRALSWKISCRENEGV